MSDLAARITDALERLEWRIERDPEHGYEWVPNDQAGRLLAEQLETVPVSVPVDEARSPSSEREND